MRKTKHHNSHIYKLYKNRPRAQKTTPAARAAATGPEPHTEPAAAQIITITYNNDGLINETTGLNPDKHENNLEGQKTWVHIQGQPNQQQLEALGNSYNIHALTIEDIQHGASRLKVEDYELYQFIVLRKIWNNAADLDSAQINFLLYPDCVISIDASQVDHFDSVRKLIHSNNKICKLGADYLLYTLIDAIVDTGFGMLDGLGDELEELENQVLEEPSKDTRNQIYFLKRKLLLLHKAWWPQREVITSLLREDQEHISKSTKIFLRDSYDHCVILLDFVETYREIAAGLLDTYLSAVSQRMNDIMKGLSIVATIFLPLTFLSGLYGMNFSTDSPWNMPELGWRFGYLYVLALMLLVAIGMLVYFRRKKWL